MNHLTVATENSASSMVSFLFELMKWGGAAIAGVGIIVFILAKKNNNDDLSTNAIWIVLGGAACAAIGTYLGGIALPTISG